VGTLHASPSNVQKPGKKRGGGIKKRSIKEREKKRKKRPIAEL